MASPNFGLTVPLEGETAFDADMAFLRSLFKDDKLPKDRWARKLYIDMSFDEFFGIVKYSEEMIAECGFAAQLLHPSLDMTHVCNYKAAMEAYIHNKIAMAFPGVTFFEYFNQPREIIEAMNEVATSNTARTAIEESKAQQQMKALLGTK